MLPKKFVSALFAIGTAAFLTTHTEDANAATFVCNGGIDYVDIVAVSSTNTRLQVGCFENGVLKHVVAHLQESNSAYNRNIETLKLWASQVQAAILSGRQMNLYHDVVGGNNVLTAISLRRQ